MVCTGGNKKKNICKKYCRRCRAKYTVSISVDCCHCECDVHLCECVNVRKKNND